MTIEADKARARILRFLSRGSARLVAAAAGDGVLIEAEERGAVSADKSLLQALAREGLILVDETIVSLGTPTVRSAEGAAAGCGPTEPRRRDLGAVAMDTGSGEQIVVVNWAESPLAQLMRRKDRDGAPFLSAAEYESGERLRSDYTRGQIMPRLGANWVASVSSARRAGGVADLTDAALAARRRVELAVAAVGPELSGVLIDVCCFLKGMETVEAERGWPVRSAKIVLKTALGVLSRHYNPNATAKVGRRTLHWGAADYRPRMG